MSKFSLPRVRALSDGQFLEALYDPRTRLECVQAGRNYAYPQWAVQRRVIAEHLLYLITEHTCVGAVGGRKVRLDPGCFVWVMPGTPHEFQIPAGEPQFGMFHFKIGIYGNPGATALRPASRMVFIERAQELQSACTLAIQEGLSGARFSSLRFRAALLLLFSQALALGQGTPLGTGTLTKPQQQVIRAYVAEHLSRRPSPGELAAQIRLSRDYFARAFRATFGVAPRAWLVRERMNAAAQRLANTPLSISEIAYELGFRDVFLFSRQFKNVYGTSPRKYRRALP